MTDWGVGGDIAQWALLMRRPWVWSPGWAGWGTVFFCPSESTLVQIYLCLTLLCGIHICVHVKDLICICRKNVGLTSGDMVTQKDCIHLVKTAQAATPPPKRKKKKKASWAYEHVSLNMEWMCAIKMDIDIDWLVIAAFHLAQSAAEVILILGRNVSIKKAMYLPTYLILFCMWKVTIWVLLLSL